ncbi:MAG TPA: cytochrome d ubiquinol oxidase subunit II [Candidatus Tumulicola sp.]
MATLAFCVIAVLLAAYVVLDGFDLGIASIAPFIARNDAERRIVMESIGPFWNGNEVCLIAAGAALFALFPTAYAVSFSGFYLPFIIVLWMLMFRGIAMELRDHLASDLWHQFWDFAFWLSSGLLIVLFGVALGNLVRGVPLDAQGYFQGSFAFLLNPYAIAVALLAVAALGVHGASFARLRIDGPPAIRALAVSNVLWWCEAALFLFISVATRYLYAGGSHPSHPTTYAFGGLALLALVAQRITLGRTDAGTFAASTGFLLAMMAAAAASMYPYILRAYPPGGGGLSIDAAVPSPVALTTALVVTIGGGIAVAAYGSAVFRRMAGKLRVEDIVR